MTTTITHSQKPQPNLEPVRRPWCIYAAFALLLLGLLLNAFYLFHHSPIDLTEDESHYWEWSRHFDFGYYSKPPGIAWTIAAALRIGEALHLTGDGSGQALAPVIRMPALLFGFCSGLLSLFFARRIFRDDRAALAVTLLSAAVPMFAIGSLLITIDSPMYLCWAATVYCLWRRIEAFTKNGGGSAWLYAAGIACAAGMLFKPVLIAIPICAAIAAWRNPEIRRALHSWHTLFAALIASLSQIPVLIWNSLHDWVTLHHILTQGGFKASDPAAPHTSLLAPLARLGSFLGGQAGGMAGAIFVLLVIAVCVIWKRQRTPQRTTAATFLLSFTLPLWLFYFIMNLWKETEVNWPAASYFTGMILLAGVVVEGWNSSDPKHRRTWRSWTTAIVVYGILATSFTLNIYRFFPFIAAHTKALNAPMTKLHGLSERGALVGDLLAQWKNETHVRTVVVTNRWDTSSSLSFYLPNHPFVYCIMSLLGERMNQYDLWPQLNGNADRGVNVLLIGPYSYEQIDTLIRPAFDHIDEISVNGVQRPNFITLPIVYEGVPLKTVGILKCYGFNGFPTARTDRY